MSKFIEIGDSALNLNAVARLELKDPKTQTYYVHVKDSAMLYQTDKPAVTAALSTLVPIHQEVQIYTLETNRPGDELESEEVSVQYRGLATHIISGPLVTQSYNCYVSAGFSLADASNYYESAEKAVVHCSDGVYWGIYRGTGFCIGADFDSSPESHFNRWFCDKLGEYH